MTSQAGLFQLLVAIETLSIILNISFSKKHFIIEIFIELVHGRGHFIMCGPWNCLCIIYKQLVFHVCLFVYNKNDFRIHDLLKLTMIFTRTERFSFTFTASRASKVECSFFYLSSWPVSSSTTSQCLALVQWPLFSHYRGRTNNSSINVIL